MEKIVKSSISRTRFIARDVNGKPYLLCEGDAASNPLVLQYVNEVRNATMSFDQVFNLATLLASKI